MAEERWSIHTVKPPSNAGSGMAIDFSLRKREETSELVEISQEQDIVISTAPACPEALSDRKPDRDWAVRLVATFR